MRFIINFESGNCVCVYLVSFCCFCCHFLRLWIINLFNICFRDPRTIRSRDLPVAKLFEPFAFGRRWFTRNGTCRFRHPFIELEASVPFSHRQIRAYFIHRYVNIIAYPSHIVFRKNMSKFIRHVLLEKYIYTSSLCNINIIFLYKHYS